MESCILSAWPRVRLNTPISRPRTIDIEGDGFLASHRLNPAGTFHEATREIAGLQLLICS
jgi:hypothetical protein